MKSKNNGKSIQPGQSAAGNAPAPRKRFHIQKLEERIAPKKGGRVGQTSSGGISYSYVGPY